MQDVVTFSSCWFDCCSLAATWEGDERIHQTLVLYVICIRIASAPNRDEINSKQVCLALTIPPNPLTTIHININCKWSFTSSWFVLYATLLARIMQLLQLCLWQLYMQCCNLISHLNRSCLIFLILTFYTWNRYLS